MNNNEKLIKLKAKYGLTHPQLATMLCATIDTSQAWTCNPKTTRHNRVSDATLLLLNYVIKDMKLKPVK